jgi:microcystin degradation protein MlrC
VVEHLGDGKFTGTGPFYAGVSADLGPMALLRRGGVHVAVSTRRMQAADQAMFHHLGVEPKEQKILALKSSVHFRADFGPLASEVLLVEAPGAFIVRNDRLAYRKLRAGVRVTPLGQPRQ